MELLLGILEMMREFFSVLENKGVGLLDESRTLISLSKSVIFAVIDKSVNLRTITMSCASLVF